MLEYQSKANIYLEAKDTYTYTYASEVPTVDQRDCAPIMEENFAKRRKINHSNDRSIFGTSSTAASAMGPSGASAFVLETEELLKGVKLDYSKALPGVDDILRQFKDTIESLEPHNPTPVSRCHSADPSHSLFFPLMF